MRKVLVTYATKSGSVEDIAQRIGETLREQGMDAEVRPIGEKPAAADYDAVVVGSGARAGGWQQSAKDWVKANAAALAQRPVAVFTVGLTQATEPDRAPEVAAYADPALAEAGLTAVDRGAFAGWFLPERFGFAERGILKLMKAPTGDFRDMSAVAGWTASIAPKLGS